MRYAAMNKWIKAEALYERQIVLGIRKGTKYYYSPGMMVQKKKENGVYIRHAFGEVEFVPNGIGMFLVEIKGE